MAYSVGERRGSKRYSAPGRNSHGKHVGHEPVRVGAKKVGAESLEQEIDSDVKEAAEDSEIVVDSYVRAYQRAQDSNTTSFEGLDALRSELVELNPRLAYHTFKVTGDYRGCDDALEVLAASENASEILFAYIAANDQIELRRRKHTYDRNDRLREIIEKLEEHPVVRRIKGKRKICLSELQ